MIRPLVRLAPAVLALLLAACAPKPEATGPSAPTVTVGAVRVEGAQLREGLPGVEDGVLYLTLVNTGEAEVRLSEATTPIAREVRPMRDHGAHDATPLDPVVPPGGSLRFAPGGDHLMLVGLTRPPVKGEEVEVTLTLDPGGPVTLNVPVNPY